MSDREAVFKAALAAFPVEAREILLLLPDRSGSLAREQVGKMQRILGLDREGLMIRLLDLAQLFAVVPVSGFLVGAVVAAREGESGPAGLFLGANYEFSGQALNQSIHAEQSATMNAWHQGARNLEAVAVTDAPCGHCRQFLYEFGQAAGSVRIITLEKDSRACQSTELGGLLKRAFCPEDLDNPTCLATLDPGSEEGELALDSIDPLVQIALEAANQSYAPYTDNRAGCALQLASGRVFSGSYVENAAYNPSLSPLHTTVLRMNLSLLEDQPTLERVVLVERPTIIRQRIAVESLLTTWAPEARFDYHRAEAPAPAKEER